jgi:uncharacterized membrane protein
MIAGTSSPQPYYHPTGFRVGSALSRAIDVLFGNFVPFIAISAIATAPLFIFALTRQAGLQPRYVTWVQLLLHFMLSALCEAMILYATFQALRNRPVRPAESIARGLQRFGPVLLATLYTTIVIGLGCVLLIVPGIIASIIFCVTLPACVVERLGAIESMERSSALTRGYRWPIFGAFLVISIVSLIASALITGLLRGTGPVWLMPTVTFLWDTLAQAYQTVLVAIIYHDLRVVKDGIDLENIASVFD